MTNFKALLTSLGKPQLFLTHRFLQTSRQNLDHSCDQNLSLKCAVYRRFSPRTSQSQLRSSNRTLCSWLGPGSCRSCSGYSIILPDIVLLYLQKLWSPIPAMVLYLFDVVEFKDIQFRHGLPVSVSLTVPTYIRLEHG